MSALMLLLACVRPSLEADDAEQRRRAVVAMGVDALRAELPVLLHLAQHDPSPAVRAAVLRELGLTRDPAVVPVLEQAAAAHPGPVLEAWTAWGGDFGCRRARRVQISRADRAWRWFLTSPCNEPGAPGRDEG